MDNNVQEPKMNKKNAFHFDWIIPVFFKPRKMISKIVLEEKAVWLTPLVVISALILISTLIAAPIRRTAIQMGMNIPVDFQYYSAEQQAQFMSAQANQTSPLFLYVFPILIGLVSLWLSWFILSSLLHLSLTLSGSRANNIRSYNLAGWSYLPIALRYIVQIVAMIFTKTTISSHGLSGFIASDATGLVSYLGAMLGLIDLYFIWQIVLLVIGVVPLSGLTKSKAWIATAISILILVLLQALPGFASNALSGISVSSPFFF
jgi:hypothetical protein